jgi:hypothetical protein
MRSRCPSCASSRGATPSSTCSKVERYIRTTPATDGWAAFAGGGLVRLECRAVARCRSTVRVFSRFKRITQWHLRAGPSALRCVRASQQQRGLMNSAVWCSTLSGALVVPPSPPRGLALEPTHKAAPQARQITTEIGRRGEWKDHSAGDHEP